MNKKGFNVVVIGGDHYNTYGIVRSLGECGIKTHVFIHGKRNGKSFVLKSKYVELGSCYQHGEAIISELLQRFDEQTDNIVICCSDFAEELVLNHYNNLSNSFILPVCRDHRETLRLMKKDEISLLAEQHGLLIPKSWRVKNRDIPDNITFPCITKPLTSTSGQKSDIVVCRDLEALKKVVLDDKRCSDYIVQDYIDYDKEISILGVSLNNGDVVFSGCIDKLRTCSIGTSSFAVMVDHAILGDALNKLEAMMQMTGYRGLFSAEFLKSGNKLYFLEVNFRNDGNTYVATASGNNLPLLYVQSFLTEKVKSNKASYPCYFMLDIEDFLARGRNNVSFSEWKRNLHQANCCLVYNKDDKKPFKKKILLLIEFYTRVVLHKLKLVKKI